MYITLIDISADFITYINIDIDIDMCMYILVCDILYYKYHYIYSQLLVNIN